jgi:hypothetical protein
VCTEEGSRVLFGILKWEDLSCRIPSIPIASKPELRGSALVCHNRSRSAGIITYHETSFPCPCAHSISTLLLSISRCDKINLSLISSLSRFPQLRRSQWWGPLKDLSLSLVLCTCVYVYVHMYADRDSFSVSFSAFSSLSSPSSFPSSLYISSSLILHLCEERTYSEKTLGHSHGSPSSGTQKRRPHGACFNLCPYHQGTSFTVPPRTTSQGTRHHHIQAIAVDLLGSAYSLAI